ncbi:MAG TPA: cytochrome c [Candidatus Limnocylindria bacterium]|jgi:mono/diheme cytochrome c family protein
MRRVLLGCSALLLLVLACAPEPPATDPIGRGRQLYRSVGCANCHEPGLFGRRLGPPLDHAGTLAGTRRAGMSAADYLRESIVDPGAYVVPGYQDSMPRDLGRDLSPTDLDDLVAYLLSLR